MLTAHLAARLLERQRAERSAEIARQLPLYRDDPAYPAEPEQDGEARRTPDWATHY